MRLCVQPNDFGWQAADEDSLDCDQDYDGHKTYRGQFAHGDTRKQALEGLLEIYEELQEFPEGIRSVEIAADEWCHIGDRLARGYQALGGLTPPEIIELEKTL
jgi:hypothetical protein